MSKDEATGGERRRAVIYARVSRASDSPEDGTDSDSVARQVAACESAHGARAGGSWPLPCATTRSARGSPA